MADPLIQPPSITDDQRRRLQELEPRIRQWDEALGRLQEAGVEVGDLREQLSRQDNIRRTLLSEFSPRRAKRS